MLTIKKYQEAKAQFDAVMADIRYVQQRLNYHGFKCDIDGKWGTETQRVLGDFQKAKGLKVDHVVGPATMAELKKEKVVIKHFKEHEFKCKCNGKYCKGLPSKGISKAFLQKLELVRAEVNRLYPGKERIVIVNSGYRCPEWNRRVGGAKSSKHMSNPVNAADIRIPGITPKQLGVICDKIFHDGGVGLGGATIVHVDDRGKRARWYYN